MSLFCGACSVETKLSTYFTNVICNDNHEYLIALLQAVQDGWQPPVNITEEQYRYVCNHKDEDKALAGFVGFACSFGAKWFGGYARSNVEKRNYALEGRNALLRDNKLLQNVKFTCMDYQDVPLPEGCVVYADPPYNNTTQYRNEKFNSDSFWEYAREISKTHMVFISELSAPEDFVSIWHKSVTRTLDVNKNNYFRSVENLYIHKCNLIDKAK